MQKLWRIEHKNRLLAGPNGKCWLESAEFQYITFYEYLLTVTLSTKTHYPSGPQHSAIRSKYWESWGLFVFQSHRKAVSCWPVLERWCVLTARVCLTDWAIYSSWLFYQQPVKKAEQQNPSSCRYCIVPAPPPPPPALVSPLACSFYRVPSNYVANICMLNLVKTSICHIYIGTSLEQARKLF